MGRLTCENRFDEQQQNLVHSGDVDGHVFILGLVFVLVAHIAFCINLFLISDGILFDHLAEDN